MNSNSSEIAKHLKCNRCEDYLLPPIIQCVQGHILCNNCWDGKEDCSKCRNNFIPVLNRALGKIANDVLFPCPFAIKGCIAHLKWKEIVQHKIECVFRCMNCPLAEQNGCRWKGFNTDIPSHFIEDHDDWCLELNKDNEVNFYLDLSDPYHNVSLIEALKQAFLLHTIRTNKTNHTILVLQHIGAAVETAKYHFQLELRDPDNTKFCMFKAPVVPSCIDVTKTNKRISISDSQLFEIGETLCSLKINKIMRTEEDEDVSSSQLAPEELVKEIECPVCAMHMSAPIFQCDRGHSICGNCKAKIEQCPTCMGSLNTVRNFTLESLVSKLRVSCSFTELGCTRNGSTEEMGKHESVCDFAKEKCLHCSRRGKIEELLDHAENDHELMERGYSTFKLLTNETSVFKRVIEHNNQLLFWYGIRDMERNSLHFIIKTYDKNLKCKYTVKIRDDDNERRIANTEYICTDYKKSLEEIIRSGKCVSIPLHKAQTFLCENGDLKFHLFLEKFENEKWGICSPET